MPKTATKKKKKKLGKHRGEGADRKEQILEAAKSILVKEGYDALSMRRVAAEVGISSTAVYLYFREKDELLDTVCHRVFQRLVPAMEKLLASNEDPLALLKKGLTLYLRFGFDHPDEYRIVFLTRRDARAWDHSAPLEYVDRWGQPRVNTFMYLVAGLRLAMDAEQIRQGDVMVMAQSVLAAMHGLLALLILSPDQEWAPTDVLIKETIELIMRGLQPG